MRDIRVSASSAAVVAILLAVAAGVAWSRSHDSGNVITGELSSADSISPAAVDSTAPIAVTHDSGIAGNVADVDGSAAADSAVYNRDCRGCHGAGEARGRRTPALRVLAVTLLTTEGGREYLVDFMLDGRVRAVDKGNVTYRNTHPPFDELTNAEVASVLNYMLTAWGNDKLLPGDWRAYTAAEVGRRRRAG